jgi:hypothetical protein
LLHKKLKIEEENVTVLRINMNDKDTIDNLFVQLARKGIYNDLEKLKALENQTWLLLDDAQNCYHEDFEPFWKLVVKALSTADVEHKSVCHYCRNKQNLSTPNSPVSFDGSKAHPSRCDREGSPKTLSNARRSVELDELGCLPRDAHRY